MMSIDTNSAPPSYSKRIRRSFLAMLGIVVFVVVLWTVKSLVEAQQTRIENQYAVQEVTDLICHFYLANDKQFPLNWNDLADVYPEVDCGYGLGDDGLKVLRRRIEVDFESLSELGQPHTFNSNSGRDVEIVRVKGDFGVPPVEATANERIRRLATGSQSHSQN